MDWLKLIDEIKESGMTQADIAKKCKCSTGNLSELRNGLVKNPSYALGRSLVELRDKVRVRKAAKKATKTAGQVKTN